MNSVVYIAGKAQQVPEYSGAVIDQPTLEQALAEHTKRIALDAVSAQQQIDDRALSGLAALRAESMQHQQLIDRLTKQLNDAGLLQVSAADLAAEAKAQAEAAAAAVATIPAVDVSAVARLSAEVIENGMRAVNQASQAQAAVNELASNTVAQVSELQSEVLSLQGTATNTVDQIRTASQAAVSDAITRVDEALATVPEQTRQTILSVLGETEYLIGGEVDPSDRYSFLWQFAKLSDPSTVTRTVAMPIYVGWRGQPGKSGAPVAGGGGGGAGAAGLYLDQQLTAGAESELRWRTRGNNALPTKALASPACLLKLHWQDTNNSSSWTSCTLDVGTALSSSNGEEFTIAAELNGPGPHLDLVFRVVRQSNPDRTLIYATSAVDCRIQGGVIEAGSVVAGA